MGVGTGYCVRVVINIACSDGGGGVLYMCTYVCMMLVHTLQCAFRCVGEIGIPFFGGPLEWEVPMCSNFIILLSNLLLRRYCVLLSTCVSPTYLIQFTPSTHSPHGCRKVDSPQYSDIIGREQ